MLLLSMSAHITKELGMAPGGEFRAAYQEVSNYTENIQPNCLTFKCIICVVNFTGKEGSILPVSAC